MRVRLLIGISIVWVALMFGALGNAQSIQTTPAVTPTPSTDDLRVFPGDLVCGKREATLNNDGPSWMGITIGQSTLADVEQLLSTLSDDYVFADDDDYVTRFVIPYLIFEPDIPPVVLFCLEENVVQVLAVVYSLTSQHYLNDLVAQFGEPDTVTWAGNSSSRVVFWFEQGRASVVSVYPNQPDYLPTFGRIETEIYFPYQEVEGYESRWPYNQTTEFNPYLSWPYEGRDDYGPKNPFDFEAMIATITAAPPHTSTPTIAPSLVAPH